MLPNNCEGNLVFVEAFREQVPGKNDHGPKGRRKPPAIPDGPFFSADWIGKLVPPMSDSNVASLHAWLRDQESNLLRDYRKLLQFPSIEGPAEPNAPFGKENREALDYMLGLAQETGMVTRDLEGYCGFAEFGSGERMVMTLGHLDVVPVSDGWKHEPFGAEIDGDYVYARGAIDDKGPTMAAFYAARAIQACCPNLNARIRSVFGCNEESGFKCIARYVQTEEIPTFGIAPDSGWPLYNAEKGISNLVVEMPLIQGGLSLTKLSGGQRPNIVIDLIEFEAVVSDAAMSEVKDRVASAWDKNLTVRWEGNKLIGVARGKAAHGAAPYSGDSAAARAFRFLAEVSPVDTERQYGELLYTAHPGGVGLGIDGRDDASEDLTSNLGICTTQNGTLRLLFNVRYPVTWTADLLRQKAEAKLSSQSSKMKLVEVTDSRPLFFPDDHQLVKTIIDVYEAETGERKKPGSMGGGTYARAIPNTVSVGTGWDGDGPAHENDERLKIEHLHKMSRIYAHILYRLCTV